MARSAWVVWLVMMCGMSSAWAQDVARDENGERIWRAPLIELLPFQAVSAASWGVVACGLSDCGGEVWAGAASGLVWTGGLAFVFRDGLTSAQAQALNSGVLWTSTGAMLAGVALTEQPQGLFPGLLVGAPLGLGLGALYYELADPTSGQVAAINSFALAGSVLAWTSMYSPDEVVPTSDHDGADELGGIEPGWALGFVGAGLATGVVVSRVKPLSRFHAFSADIGGAVAGGLWLALSRSFGVDEYGSLLGAGALYVGGVSLLYALLPEDDGADFFEAAPAVSLTSQPGGLGLSASWSW